MSRNLSLNDIKKTADDTNLWEITLIVQNMQDSCWFTGNEVYHRLVVLVIYIQPINFLFCILLLFQSENMLVEEKLEGLIGIVDTQLLKTVGVEILKI